MLFDMIIDKIDLSKVLRLHSYVSFMMSYSA